MAYATRELVKRPNPYWDSVADHVTQSRWEGLQVDRYDRLGNRKSTVPDRHDLVGQYAWTITDPASVAFVASHARGRIIDPMAGTGYWCYILGFHGIDAIGYDLQLPADNTWHRNYVQHAPIRQCDGADAAAAHPDRTLLLSWPPYSMSTGTRIINAYRGDRIIYIGEGAGGCCGDDDMHDLLDGQWTEIAEHVPVQWYGLWDRITVYDRAVTH